MYFKRFSKCKCDLHCSDTYSYYSFPWSNAQENGFAWFILNLCQFCTFCLHLCRWQSFCGGFVFCFFFPKLYFPSELPIQTLYPLFYKYLPFLQNIWYILCVSSKKIPYSSQELSRSFPLDELCFDWIFQFFYYGNIWPIRIRKSHLFAIGFSYYVLDCW